MVRKTHLLVLATTLWISILSGFVTVQGASDVENVLPDETRPLVVDRSAGEVKIFARMQPAAFLGGWLASTPRYHAVVWKDGKAASEALLQAYVSDIKVYNALVSLGAVPGNNLTMAAWNERNDPNSSAPDQRIQGTPVEMSVWWEGLPRPVPLKDMLVDPAGRGIDLRFGGNKALIPQWHSGCIVCLYSCPGSKVGNRAYTIRDYVRGVTSFSINWKVVPRGTRRAIVILRVHRNGAKKASD